MIIARSPLRVSFAGGGSDLPQFYRKYGPGVVVSTAIKKYVYVSISEKFGGGVSVRYRVHETPEMASGLKHALIREALASYCVDTGVEIVVSSDVPARGSGLGASSAIACALVAALERYTGGKIPESMDQKEGIANLASYIEMERVGSPIGKQDHYASAFGGMNRFDFNADESVIRMPFESEDFIREIESQSMLFYLKMEHEYKGGSGFVQRILNDQAESMRRMRTTYELQRDNAMRLWEHMQYEVPERFIDHVNENWRIKRTTHPDVTNSTIDSVVQRAFKAGATAAKVCGAGGGGFVYFMVPMMMQDLVRAELSDLLELECQFDSEGTKVLFDGGAEMGALCKKS